MSVERIQVGVEGSPYDIVVGDHVLESCGALLAVVTQAKRVSLVTDMTVADLYGRRVSAHLASAGFEVHALSMAPGEASKSWALVGELLEAMARDGIERGDVVVALGGGVVGDVAGFAAATYLRGIGFAQIPTTLLAQVDSSIGGKTGVDLAAGKNLAGAFKQPLIVLSDTDVLSTLPQAEWESGLAEVAKSAVISGDEFLEWLEQNAEGIVAREPATCAEVVLRCAAFKAGVVAGDEREVNVRECLNYGHTLGHAIEKVAGYGVFSHGLAVAEGMRFAARLSVEAGQGSMAFVEVQDRLLDHLGLAAMETSLGPDELLEVMRSDKKARGGQVRFVLVDAPGLWRCEPVPESMLKEHLAAWAESKRKDLK